MPSPTDQDKSRAEAAEIEREMTVMRREEARNPTGQSVRRLVLTVITTALVALALWVAMRILLRPR